MSQTPLSLDIQLYDYVCASNPTEHVELASLRRLTRTLPNFRMQIPREQGHFLSFLVKLIDARRVLEIGTFTGYSTLSMALALPVQGHIVTCDVDEGSIATGRPFWERAGVANQIETLIGPALQTLEGIARQHAARFDLAFIDADKTQYDGYYELALRLVRPGGLIVLDNVLQRGEVSHSAACDVRVGSIRALNAKIARDARVDHVMLPVADGTTLVRRRP